jgi:hypothetical protein
MGREDESRVVAETWYLRQVSGIMTHRNTSFLRAVGVLTSFAMSTLIVSGTWFVMTHRTSSAESPQNASAEFQRLRARFTNQQALLDMDRRQARTQQSAARNPVHLHTVHTMIFDTRGSQRLVQISVPYWLARLYGGHGELKWLGQLTFLDDTEVDPEAIDLSWKDIERHGPGLIADYQHPSGGQFMSWVE